MGHDRVVALNLRALACSRSMVRFFVIPWALISVLAAAAHAQPPGAIIANADEHPVVAAPTTYRRQLMMVDGLATATVAGALGAGAWLFHPDDFHLPLTVGALGFTSYVITAPILHFAHGNVGRGFLSGSARVLGPAVVAATLVTAAGLEEREDGYGAVFGAGFAIGAVGAMVLDWFVLTPSAPVEHSTPLVAPSISASAEHVFLGVAGTL